MADSLTDQFKDLSDLEYVIAFVDSVYKKLKSVVDNKEIRTNTLLFLYMAVVESLKRCRQSAEEANRVIPHSDVLNLIISKGDLFLSSVASDESKAPYVSKSLSDMYELVKELLYMLKSELVSSPEYSHLKR